MTELKVGIAGYGVVGKRRKDCIDRQTRLQVVAVCDRAFDRSEATPFEAFNG
jgi:glyceraldehyde-3-phosphate dehydrogenase/erythrose-4-phosphate dehydrogenase